MVVKRRNVDGCASVQDALRRYGEERPAALFLEGETPADYAERQLRWYAGFVNWLFDPAPEEREGAE